MKNALAERSVCISQRQSANETSAIAPSATASAMRPTRTKRTKRNITHSTTGSAR
jgi:hypothetical protein